MVLDGKWWFYHTKRFISRNDILPKRGKNVKKGVVFVFVPLSAVSSLKNWPAEISNLPVAPSSSFQSEVTQLSIPSKSGKSKKAKLSQQAVFKTSFSGIQHKHRVIKWYIKVCKIVVEQKSRCDGVKRTFEGVTEVNISGGRGQKADQQHGNNARLHEVFSCVSMRKKARKLWQDEDLNRTRVWWRLKRGKTPEPAARPNHPTPLRSQLLDFFVLPRLNMRAFCVRNLITAFFRHV